MENKKITLIVLISIALLTFVGRALFVPTNKTNTPLVVVKKIKLASITIRGIQGQEFLAPQFVFYFEKKIDCGGHPVTAVYLPLIPQPPGIGLVWDNYFKKNPFRAKFYGLEWDKNHEICVADFVDVE